MRATGTFDVKLEPRPLEGRPGDQIGMLALEKRFEGDLVGSSTGLMLATSTATPGSAGYVAAETVTGTLHDRRGTFVVQHLGTMSGDDSRLQIVVVPDSGTDELTGIEGAMTIDIVDGDHVYAFEYTLPGA
jgi:hypothetical protein